MGGGAQLCDMLVVENLTCDVDKFGQVRFQTSEKGHLSKRPHIPHLIVVIAHPRYLDVHMSSVLAGSGLAEYGLADSRLLTYQIPV